MIKGIIFDLNGVFIRGPLLSERMEDKFGIKNEDILPALKSVMKVIREPNAPNPYTLWKPHFEKWGLHDLTEKEFFDFWFSEETLAPELMEYARELKEKGYKIFILSNNFREKTEYQRKHFPELFNMFDGAYFSWETGFVKPLDQAYLHLLNINKLKPNECIYFDDSQENIDVAIKLGFMGEIYKDLETTKNTIEGQSRMKEQMR